jgi:lysine 2,3-aminomutase
MGGIMTNFEKIEKIINASDLFNDIISENQWLKSLLDENHDYESFLDKLKIHFNGLLQTKPRAKAFLNAVNRSNFDSLSWSDVAVIRMIDYLDNSDENYFDQNIEKDIINAPFKWIWERFNNIENEANADFFIDMRSLFRQLERDEPRFKPTREHVLDWMAKVPSGIDSDVIEIRKKAKKRIIDTFIKKMDKGEITDPKYKFEDSWDYKQKLNAMNEWWNDRIFHLKFALRHPDDINEFLDNSLSKKTMESLYRANEKGIPFFINPYYLSLLVVNEDEKYKYADIAIRDYVFYSEQLIDEFGEIKAWEKEDLVEPGKPNAAGWLLPTHHNIHRRYPNVAIFIPDTVGRSCGGLCVSCQRMYDFQSGHLNFNLHKLRPNESWNEKLKRLLKYYENDSQLRDILITGGDSFMSSNASLRNILDEVYNMIVRKKEANKNRADGEKYAEHLRVRLGTRLPVYIPQRVDDELIEILADFKKKAAAQGVKQFVIQTHFVSAMEITPEARDGINRLTSAGWMVTNQQVFTTAASLRGHTAKLRKTLNDIGVVTYYTFSVKGFRENSHNFATNSRAVQEQQEEKAIGEIDEKYFDELRKFPLNAENMSELIDDFREKNDIPFLATDRNVMNLPGVGKSLTFRVTGITPDGRRILEFDHDHTRTHSPAVNEHERVRIIESKSICQYLRQIEQLGADRDDYTSIYGYSIGLTERRMPIYQYPDYDFDITKKFTNIEL